MFGQERGVKKKKEKKKSGEIKRNVKSETFEIKFEPVKAAYSEIGISFIFLPWSSFLFHMLFSLIFFFFYCHIKVQGGLGIKFPHSFLLDEI